MFPSLKVMSILLLMSLLYSKILTAEDLDNREAERILYNQLNTFKNNSIRLGLLGPTLGLSPTGGVLNNDSVEYDEYNDDDDNDDDDDDYAFDEESENASSEPLAALTDPFTETQQVDLIPHTSHLIPHTSYLTPPDHQNYSTIFASVLLLSGG